MTNDGGMRKTVAAILLIVGTAAIADEGEELDTGQVSQCELLAHDIVTVFDGVTKIFGVESWQELEGRIVKSRVQYCQQQIEASQRSLQKCDRDFKAGRINNLKYCQWNANNMSPDCERWRDSGMSEEEITVAWTMDIPQTGDGSKRIRLCYGNARFSHMDGVHRMSFHIDMDPDGEQFIGYKLQ